ncbi:MAG: hypothetical protein NC453_21030 [Muribaculum sp.]|nr:hypothetical protein [Muribaculum sp.]
MSKIEKSILNQMWIYTAALKTLYWLKVQDKYSAQVDMTIDNLQASALMLRVEARRQLRETKCQ